MARIAVIAGTSDAREVIRQLLEEGHTVAASVATNYGSSLLESHHRLTVWCGRLNAREMAERFTESDTGMVVDASHPYARLVSETTMEACRTCGLPYLRYERQGLPLPEGEHCVVVPDTAEAAAFLAATEGRILLTTGSKNLEDFTAVLGTERLFARVLPTPSVMLHCGSLGLTSSQILAMQGPFSKEMNTAMLRHTGARWMVTKESGSAGGYEAKLAAAEEAGCGLVVIARPALHYGDTVSGLIELNAALRRYVS